MSESWRGGAMHGRGGGAQLYTDEGKLRQLEARQNQLKQTWSEEET